MIALTRPKKPSVLAQRAAAATAELQKAYTAKEPLDILPSLYGHPAVKAALTKAQHDKCAYCETRDVRSPGAVEHYRPKGGWRQNKGDPLQPPGYFWLAYEWENLLFACTMCNDAGHKENRFPLANPGKRATPKKKDHRPERPLLINPYSKTDLDRHITWSADVPKTRAKSRAGAATIDVFGLDRDTKLIDRRRDFLKFTTGIVEFCERQRPGSHGRTQWRAVLLKRLDGSEEYTAMIRANLGDRIRAL